MSCRLEQELPPLTRPLDAMTASNEGRVRRGDDAYLLVNSGDDDAIVRDT
jgi:hypothetical protein